MSSKSDTPYSAIDSSRSGGSLRTPTWRDGKRIVAFDFETTGSGDPFCLSVSPSDSQSYCVTPEGDNTTLTTEQILSELARPKWARYMCMWFNIGFDAEVFISGLGAIHAQRLRIENETTLESGEFEGLTVKYIKGKLLEFKDDNKHVVTHYDIGNIVRGSLDNCAKEWLGVSKHDTVDVTQFSDPVYREENKKAIEYYARIDAQITRRLAEAVTEKAESLDIPMGRPVSTGYMASEFARDRLDSKPGIAQSWMQSMAWESYAGGRFEVYERGSVGDVAGPDINSAYPAVLAELPDPGSLDWEKRTNAPIGDIRNADYGFVTVTLTTVEDRRILPFTEKIDDKVCYPAMREHTITTLLPTFLFALDNGYITDYEIHNAALGHATENTKYPFSFIKDIYEERKELEANGRRFAGLMLKIALNSLYGKLAQTTLKQYLLEESVNLGDMDKEKGETFMSIDGLPVLQRQEAGSMFNPFLASYITGLTRLELHKTVVDSNLEENTILLATDCLMVEADAYENSNFEKHLGDTLGEWDYDYRGNAFVVGSGVYEVDMGSCQKSYCDNYDTGECDIFEHSHKTATRGFKEAELKDGGLRGEASRSRNEPISITNTRPITLGEAMAQKSNYTVEDIGTFLSKDENERKLNADFDTKRTWPGEVSFGDLLDSSEYGTPLVVSGRGSIEDSESIESDSGQPNLQVCSDAREGTTEKIWRSPERCAWRKRKF